MRRITSASGKGLNKIHGMFIGIWYLLCCSEIVPKCKYMYYKIQSVAVVNLHSTNLYNKNLRQAAITTSIGDVLTLPTG